MTTIPVIDAPVADAPITDDPITDSPMTDGPVTDVAPIEEGDDRPAELDRSQKRLLKRLYNARSVPVIVDDRPFLTYRQASRYLVSLPADLRDAAYAQMKVQAKDKLR